MEWDEILLDIQHIVTKAGANPAEADESLIKDLGKKMGEYFKSKESKS